jgi:minichromosome maintenance protein 10
MDSSSVSKEASIKAQIASLKAQLREEELRKGRKSHEVDQIIAPATPSPSMCLLPGCKCRTDSGEGKRKLEPVKPAARYSIPSSLVNKPSVSTDKPATVRQSSVIASLSQIDHKVIKEPQTSTSRSTSFSTTPRASTELRDERLALVEDLKLGPHDHLPLDGDPDFRLLEPNSGIRLS